MKTHTKIKRYVRKHPFAVTMVLTLASIGISANVNLLLMGVPVYDVPSATIAEAAEEPREIIAPTKEQVKEEIILQAEQFNLDQQFMLDLADCESGFGYKAKNPNSTARGVYQYLIGTWEETESAKKGYERNNYKANIREAMIDISNGEYFRWVECLSK